MIPIGEIVLFGGVPLQCVCNLFLQMLAVRQLGEEVQFAPETDRLDPVADRLIVVDAPPIQPRVGRFMDNRGGDLLKCRCFRENSEACRDP